MSYPAPLELPARASILETSQQFMLGESVSPDIVYKLGRACTAHCLAAAQELLVDGTEIPVRDVVDFVLEQGAESGSGLYHDGKGWDIVGLSDLMRLKGYTVVSQNLAYESDATDIARASANGRVRSDLEKSLLVLRSDYGGRDRQRWAEPIRHTLQQGGLVLTSMQIPLLAGDGYGMHAVLVTDIDTDRDEVTYFDPDYYNTARYGSAAPTIERCDTERLMYRRPLSEHLNYMSGEVTHVLAP